MILEPSKVLSSGICLAGKTSQEIGRHAAHSIVALVEPDEAYIEGRTS
jgi:hypothetical protein